MTEAEMLRVMLREVRHYTGTRLHPEVPGSLGNFEPGLFPYEIVQRSDVPPKRAWYWMHKWAAAGFYDYGVSIDTGWFYLADAPAELVA